MSDEPLAPSRRDARRLTAREIFAEDLALDAESAGHVVSRLRPGVVSPNKVTITGQDGRLFVADGASRWEQQFRGDLKIPDAWFESWTRVLGARATIAAALGVTLWNLVIPEKQAVLPEMRWPAGDVSGAERPLMQLTPRLGPEVNLLYAADALIARKHDLAVFFRHNSHWTATGCCLAMEALAERLGLQVDWDDIRFSYRVRDVAHDLTVHLFDPAPEEAVGLLEAREAPFFASAGPEPGRNTGASFGLRNPDAPDPRRVMIFGDSYAHDMGVAFALGELFAEVIMVWSKSIDWAQVQAREAQVVVWESAERFLATVAES